MPAPTSEARPLPGRANLLALARKYRQLVTLRARRDAGASPPLAVLRTLAAAFPGCLRELDRAGLAELRRRHRAVRAALQPAPPPCPEWLAWIDDYHQLLKAALALRGSVRAPGGRWSAFVLAEVARRHGATAQQVDQTLFPPRRRP